MHRAGDSVPDFVVRNRDGAMVAYAGLWQRKNLLLVCIPADEEGRATDVSALTTHMGELTAHDTACVITRDRVDGIPCPGVVIADRWGEIQFVAGAAAVDGLPGVAELIEWLRYVQYQCPECQGEAR